MREIRLEQPIIHDDYTAVAEQMFDMPHVDNSVTVIQNNMQLPAEWNVGLIYGPSGSGKSTLMRQFGYPGDYNWDEKRAVISHFYPMKPEDVTALFSAVGFNSAPAWLRTFHNLSNGEQFRCNLAMALAGRADPILVDEFTSVVDRNVAKSASSAIQKYIRREKLKIVLASCHADIIDWLQPDWVYNPTEALTHVFPRGSLQRPQIPLKIFRSKYEAWDLFKHHHYLSGDLNKAARCFLATWNDEPVAFSAALALPNPYKKQMWRESRTVVLPDYQGLGIGVKLSDYMGAMIKAQGGTFYSKTIHPAMIAYRLRSPNWRETSHSRQARKPNPSFEARNWVVTNRLCYAFEYIGPATTEDEAKLFGDNVNTTGVSREIEDTLSARDKDILRKREYRRRKKAGEI